MNRLIAIVRSPRTLSWAVLVAAALLVQACYSPTLPLPPPARDGLTVEAPDEDGVVIVRGEPGVMEPGQQALVVNLDTMYGWIVPVDEEGFEALVLAESGDIISIRRKDGDEMGPAVELVVPQAEE